MLRAKRFYLSAQIMLTWFVELKNGTMCSQRVITVKNLMRCKSPDSSNDRYYFDLFSFIDSFDDLI